jgi:hypothetical protein
MDRRREATAIALAGDNAMACDQFKPSSGGVQAAEADNISGA